MLPIRCLRAISRLFLLAILCLPASILAASLRNPRYVVEALIVGADVGTLTPNVLWQLLQHPLTDLGLERFLSDWKALGRELL